ncbi:MAG: T9SS type A sorting domain-containing protein [Sphingobacteriales bacterium]|nr:MAG: T9SS type A sorting domain-containing protein [Sphingobacteriales bacterium]
MKKFTILAGLLLTLGAGTLRAQTHEFTSYLPGDKEDYRGYCIERAEFDKGKGYLVAGSRTEGGKNTTVQVMSIIAGNASTSHQQVLYLPRYDDVRAIAITMVKPNLAALLLQTSSGKGLTHPTIVLIDCQDFSNLQVLNIRELADGEFKFPTSICVSGDKDVLYVAGYSLDNFNPDLETAKRGFVTAVRVKGLDAIATRLYDSPDAPNGNKDYDMIQRVRWINDRLYAIGSVNGVEKQYKSSTSRGWVAQLDATDLHINQQSTFGNDAWAYTGVQGVDLVPDVLEPGYFYVVGNEYYWHTWCISRLQPNLEIVSGGSGFNNTIWYAYSADIKGSGVVAHNDGRLSVYGTMRANLTVPANVAPFNSGAVPFVTSFDPVNSSTTGFGFSNLTWYNEGNLTTTPTNLQSRYSPFWKLTGALSYWAIPDFTVPADPSQPQSDLAMIGHVGYTGSYPNYQLAPRLIESDPNGWVDKCDGSVEVTKETVKGVLPRLLLKDKIDVSEKIEELKMSDIGYDFPSRDHKTQNCTQDGYFRQAQPAAVVVTGNGKLVFQSLVPNPATDAVTLNWTGAVAADATLHLEIVDLIGRKVGHGSLQNRSTTSGVFALSQLSPGIYVASLYVNGTFAGQQKLSIR